MPGHGHLDTEATYGRTEAMNGPVRRPWHPDRRRRGGDVSTPGGPPSLHRFVAREFAVRSPFWSWLVFERVGGALAYLFFRAGVPPNAVTLLGGAAGIAGATRLGTATEGVHVVVAAALLLLAYSLDCADGQLARATQRASPQGAWLDVTVDGVVIAFLSTSLSHALHSDGVSSPWSFLLAGAFGASRVSSLFTAGRVKGAAGGIKLAGLRAVSRNAYVALIETPFVYALLCAFRLEGDLFVAVIAAVTLLTAIKTAASARAHFSSSTSGAATPATTGCDQ